MPQYPCGACELCHQGEFVYCEHSHDALAVTGNAHGTATYAETMIKQDWMLVPIPDDISTEHASMLNCALGPAFGALRRLGTTGLHTVLVTGLGPVGLGAVIMAKRCGARVIATDPSSFRAQLGRDLGADNVLDPADPEILAQIRGLTNGLGVDQVLECAGAVPAQRLAIDAVRRLGSVAFVGEAGELKIHVSNDLIRKGINVFGSWYYNLAETAPLMQIVPEIGPLLDRLVTHKFAMSEVETAFRLQADAKCGKVLLYP
jgi:L-iditol 2-dehydrogenase